MIGNEYKYLNCVNTPEHLRKLSIAELKEYANELRRYIVECCATNPGHLGSSLGAVELTIALHYVYDTPADSIVWDVGHQAYAHKIITERRDTFTTNRKYGGISGFPRMSESRYDAFGGGHASVSISAAFGIAKAQELQQKPQHVVAVIGDGALTGGLAFEGLNNAGASPKTDILVVLNDNEMSIDKPAGALDSYLVRISTSRWYNTLKRTLWRGLSVIPPLHRLVRKTGNAIKHGLLQNSNLFESLNFRYFGPVDGHDIEELIRTLRGLKDIGGPKLLHIKTTKGKGYAPAEADPAVWHAPGRFDVATGERVKSTYPADRYQDVFGQTLLDLAHQNDKIVGITPAMPSGCSMNIVMREMPERCFDVGIAEGHAVTFSAG
ncbi:MAG: 1-deoxy-D-xylulose-5-phosphate synthase N-terminal domain-containing protein, partial [Alistipes sp.]|nr:1-deoxy-D-xylulose-5-phosphate synthase N-terminal domain-containing protein [Alistipes sp.]